MRKVMVTAVPLVLAAAMLLAGCQTTQVSLADYAPVALISVYGNSSVPWYVKDATSEDDNSTGGMLSGMVNRALGANNPEIQTVNSRIDGAADTLRTQLERHGIAVIDQGVVENSAMFKQNGNSFFTDIGDEVPAEGYKVISPTSTKRNRELALQTGAGGTMYAQFTFRKQKISTGLTTYGACAMVTLEMYVADVAGRKALSKTYTAVSPDSTPYKNGNWDKQAVCDMFPDVIRAVVNQFLMDYTGVQGAADASAEPVELREATPLGIPAGVVRGTGGDASPGAEGAPEAGEAGGGSGEEE